MVLRSAIRYEYSGSSSSNATRTFAAVTAGAPDMTDVKGSMSNRVAWNAARPLSTSASTTSAILRSECAFLPDQVARTRRSPAHVQATEHLPWYSKGRVLSAVRSWQMYPSLPSALPLQSRHKQRRSRFKDRVSGKHLSGGLHHRSEPLRLKQFHRIPDLPVWRNGQGVELLKYLERRLFACHIPVFFRKSPGDKMVWDDGHTS